MVDLKIPADGTSGSWERPRRGRRVRRSVLSSPHERWSRDWHSRGFPAREEGGGVEVELACFNVVSPSADGDENSCAGSDFELVDAPPPFGDDGAVSYCDDRESL
jgi:hypothetical protein